MTVPEFEYEVIEHTPSAANCVFHDDDLFWRRTADRYRVRKAWLDSLHPRRKLHRVGLFARMIDP